LHETRRKDIFHLFYGDFLSTIFEYGFIRRLSTVHKVYRPFSLTDSGIVIYQSIQRERPCDVTMVGENDEIEVLTRDPLNLSLAN